MREARERLYLLIAGIIWSLIVWAILYLFTSPGFSYMILGIMIVMYIWAALINEENEEMAKGQ